MNFPPKDSASQAGKGSARFVNYWGSVIVKIDLTWTLVFNINLIRGKPNQIGRKNLSLLFCV